MGGSKMDATEEKRNRTMEDFNSIRETFSDKTEAQKDQACNQLAWQVVTENLQLVHWVLQRDSSHTETILRDYDGAVSYLTEALYNATWNHKPQLGAFSTYATACLRYALIAFKTTMRIQESPFSVPITPPNIERIIEDMKRAIQTERFTHTEAESRAIERFNAAERSIAARTGQYHRVYGYPTRDEDGFFDGELLPSEYIADPTDMAETIVNTHGRNDTIAIALGTLGERECYVIQLRFGLLDGTDHTLQDIAEKFGVTRERIRQIEARAMRKLRSPPLRRLWRLSI